ncbi:helicase-related protein [Aerosakkonemataceae cyanobacterium BLCC-F50]|uniref:Helicase-related protein n=1 Tax=Floridaenema flaviceps BLCC-F50 TaxID=3153642 RepID=A0ABV4XTS3_9CYAN
MVFPGYIDNNKYKLETILRDLILYYSQTNLDIATGFFRIEAWIRLEEAFNILTNLRILIGRDPAILPAERAHIDLQKYYLRELQSQLEQEPYNLQYKQQVDRLIAYLSENHIYVRLYGAVGDDTPLLRGKAYIFDEYSIIGSSNFTLSGLNDNTELNILNKQKDIAQNLRTDWFENLWNHPSVELNYKAKLIDTLNKSKFGSKVYTPYQVFIKALYEFFKQETGIGEGTNTTLELASFQQEGYEQAVRLLERHRGIIVADSVGLGKTYIALRLIEHYLVKERRTGHVPRALVVCPAQLRDLVWLKKIDEFGIKADVLSQEEISRSEFNFRFYSKHDIVVVDESHNFRNSATNRYRNLQLLISSGNRYKRVILLTATPINNSIYDLYHQIMLLTRNSETYYRQWGISNLKSYFINIEKGLDITDLLLTTMVRRSRQDVIKRQLAGEKILIAGKEIRFPKRKLDDPKFTYNFEGSFHGLYAGIADQIDQLNLAPYNILSFKKRKDKEDKIQIKRNEALVALMKTLYLKRLESSLIAFENSISYQMQFQQRFYQYLQDGKLLKSKIFRKILAAEIDENETIKISDLISSLEEVEPKDYYTDELQQVIYSDIKTLAQIVSVLNQIKKAVQIGQDYDRKLEAFKQLLKNHLKQDKILVFSYFKDTAKYLYNELVKDKEWLEEMRLNKKELTIDLLTGDTPVKMREEKVKCFAPLSNCENEEELQDYRNKEIDIFICTDVLSEGQNLQDARVVVNYDLHWNPVRMIQRAGRIDRLGTNYEELLIYNCFPEEGLEALLKLVEKLQKKIADINQTVGLDGSILGEVISDKSLEEIIRLKQATTDAEKAEILEELELVADLVSLDEMRFPLLEFIQQVGQEAVEDIPLGIHSTRTDITKERDGIFLGFRVRDKHFWHFYPRINGTICTALEKRISEKRKIFNWLKCKADHCFHSDEMQSVVFDNDIFGILEQAVDNLLQDFKRQQVSSRLKPRLPKLLQKIYHSLNLYTLEPEEEAIKQRVLKVITTVNLRIYERDIKPFWERYVENQDLNALVSALNDLFVAQELDYEIDEQDLTPTEIIKAEEIQLICYQWFKHR